MDTSFAGSPFAEEQEFTVGPLLSQPERQPNGVVQFSFRHDPNATYEILSTTNVALPITEWDLLGLPAFLGEDLYQFTDSPTPQYPQRFYQLKRQ